MTATKSIDQMSYEERVQDLRTKLITQATEQINDFVEKVLEKKPMGAMMGHAELVFGILDGAGVTALSRASLKAADQADHTLMMALMDASYEEADSEERKLIEEVRAHAIHTRAMEALVSALGGMEADEPNSDAMH